MSENIEYSDGGADSDKPDKYWLLQQASETTDELWRQLSDILWKKSVAEVQSDVIIAALASDKSGLPGMRWPVCKCGKDYIFAGRCGFQIKLSCWHCHTEIEMDALDLLEAR